MTRRAIVWLLWCLFALLAAAALAMLVPACGLVEPIGARLTDWHLDFCPGPPLALSAEATRTDALRRIADAMELELGRRRLACASVPPPPALELPQSKNLPLPQQTALLKPPPTPPPPPRSPAPLPADRWASKDLSLLEGCWQLGRAVSTLRRGANGPGSVETCTTTASRLCFDRNGRGQQTSTQTCPISGTAYCNRPLTASFADDGTLRSTTPAVTSQGVPITCLSGSLSCRRVDDAHAVCRSHTDTPGFPDYDAEFHRMP